MSEPNTHPEIETVEILSGPVRRSPSIATLTDALSKAQGEMSGASKDKNNPHFKSSYADLASGWDACRAALSKNGLAVLQPAVANGQHVTVTTLLSHKSGEWIEAELTMVAQQNTPQAIGSCITYARRYGMFSLVGIAPEDDDGNEASKSNGNSQQAQQRPAVAPDGYEDWWADMQAVADEGTPRLSAAINGSKPEFRNFLIRHNNAAWEALKAKAAKVKVSA